MRRLLAGLCILGAVAVVAGQADARAVRRVTLRVGDGFVVSGTSLGCQTEVGKNVIKGQKLITCFKLKGSNLAPKSYIVALGANGRVVVARSTATGNIGAPVFDRKPAAAGAGGKLISVHAGDELVLAGTDLGCGINDDASGVYPACFRASAKGGGLPGSYGFAETERFIAVVQFDTTGKHSKAVFKRQHGH
jgi:hypothetical protein